MSYRTGLAQMLWYDQGKKCYYCNVEIDWHGDKSQIDHKHAQSKGGTDEISNLCLTCPECNLLKSSLSEEEFRHSLTIYYRNEKAAIRKDRAGRVVVHYPNHVVNPNINKCMHGVYDPMDLKVVSEFCSICNSSCPISLSERNTWEGWRIRGSLNAIVQFIKKILNPWKEAVVYWWNKECHVK